MSTFVPAAACPLLLGLSSRDRAEFFPGDLHARLKGLPFEFITMDPAASSAAWPDLLRASGAEVLLSGWDTPPLPADLPVARDGAIRYVCHLAGSVRQLVPRPLIERGLRVTNWGSSASRSVAEGTLLLILSALRRSSHWAIAMHRDRGWKEGRGVTESLFGRSVGLHGFGLVARQLVALLAPFGVSLSAFADGVSDEILHAHGVRPCSSLAELFSTHDVVVGLASGNDANFHIITESLLRLLPPGAVFVNAGRGGNVDEAALVRVAREGEIQVALDVFEVEPLPADSPLRGLPNVTLMPHLGGPTSDRRRDCGEFALANLERYLGRQSLEAEVTPAIYDVAS